MPEAPIPPTQEKTLVDLLRLKRHEGPGDEYFDELLPRIHTRLRAEMMRKSSASLFAERIGVFFDNLAGGRWVAGGLAAYATVMVGALVVLQWSSEPEGNSPAGLQPVSLQGGGPVQPQQIRVPVQFKIVPVQPLSQQPQQPAQTPVPAQSIPTVVPSSGTNVQQNPPPDTNR